MIGPFSASQVDTFRRCHHRWGLRYLDGVTEPTPPGAAKGTAMHSVLERMLGTGRLVAGELTVSGVLDAAECEQWDVAKRGLHLLPSPQDVAPGEIEREFEFEYRGVTWRGRIDLSRMRAGETPKVWDHKSTSDMRWAKRPEELRDDLQAALYAKVGMLETGADTCELQWTYFPRPAKQKPAAVRLTVMHDEVDRVLDAATEDALEMHAAKTAGKKAEDLARNWNACSAYGGCPHRSRCGSPPDGGIAAAFAQDEERQHRKEQGMGSLLRRLVSDNKDPINPPESAPLRAAAIDGKAVPAPAAAPAPATKGKGGVLRRLESKSNGAAAAPVEDPALEFPPKDEPAQQALPASIPAAAAAASGEVLEEQPSGVFDSTPAPKPAAAPAASKVETAGLRSAASSSTPVEPKRQGFTLYVDCRPVRGGGILFEADDLVEPAHEAVRKSYGVDDYRLVEYGKGPGAFAAALRKLFEMRPIGADGAVCITTKTREGQDALAVLERLAGTVVRGMP